MVYNKELTDQHERNKKMPCYGSKVQDNFIKYIKTQINVDLEKARDTEFDTRKYFNIDLRKIGYNDYRKFQVLLSKYNGGYEVDITDNGQYRKAIFVKRKWWLKNENNWHLPPEERAKVRSKTFPGIALAMAEQWG